MDPARLHDLVMLGGATLIGGAVLGGLGVLAGEMRQKMARGRRLAGGPAAVVGGPSEGAGLFDPVKDAFKRLGQHTAVRDPSKVSVLRAKLIQAGYFNREAPAIYLGVRAAALVAATVGVLLTLPLVAGGGG
jgi:tight adherence protein C